MRAFLPALLLLGACAAPSPADPTDPARPAASAPTPAAEPIDEPAAFDALGWMAAAEAAETEAEQVAVSARLLDAVDWRGACGEDDPTAPGRGTLSIVHLSERQSLAAVTCQQYATQNAFALVDARAGRPLRLVRALAVGDDGRPTGETTASFFGALSHDRAQAPSRFDVVTKAAGHGGCGTAVRYRLLADGGAEIESVRAHPDCDDARAPETWPQTYPG